MNTINARIIEIIDKICGGNRSEFARRLKITPTYAAQLYKGERIPGDRLVSSICQEFDIRQEWFEFGRGDMKYPERQGDMMEYINELTAESPSPFAELIRAALIAYVDSDPKDRPILDRFAQSIIDKK